MATITLNELERHILVSTFRNPGRRGTGKDARATRRLLRAIDEAGVKAQVRAWEEEARRLGVRDVLLPNGAVVNTHVMTQADALRADAEGVQYELEAGSAEFLYAELRKVDEDKQVPLSADVWVDLLDKADAAWKVAREESDTTKE